MRCFGEFINDRICNLCVDIIQCKAQKKISEKVFQDQLKLERKLEHCPHRHGTYVNDWQHVYVCDKNGKGFVRDCEYCNPKEICLVYLL